MRRAESRYKGEISGVVYPENNDAGAAFTHQRLEMIRLLTGSAAIALENASLYRLLDRAG